MCNPADDSTQFVTKAQFALVGMGGLIAAGSGAAVLPRHGECPENGGMTPREVRSVGSIAGWGNADAMGVAVDCDRR